MLYFHTMLGSSVCMHGNFHTPKSICRHARVKCLHAWHTPKSICRAWVKCLHAWKFPYTQKYICRARVKCLHAWKFPYTQKYICRARVKCLHAWKFPYTQKYTGQVFACMEISIHPKVYAVLGSSVCMHGNFHTPKSICRARVKCLHAWKFPYTQSLCRSVCMLGNFHTPKSVCRSVLHPCRARVKCLHAWKFPYTQKYMPYSGQVFACMEISIHPKSMP